MVYYRQENTEPPVPAPRQNPELTSPEKNLCVDRQPSGEIVTRGKKDIEDFLQKVRGAKQTKPTW